MTFTHQTWTRSSSKGEPKKPKANAVAMAAAVTLLLLHRQHPAHHARCWCSRSVLVATRQRHSRAMAQPRLLASRLVAACWHVDTTTATSHATPHSTPQPRGPPLIRSCAPCLVMPPLSHMQLLLQIAPVRVHPRRWCSRAVAPAPTRAASPAQQAARTRARAACATVASARRARRLCSSTATAAQSRSRWPATSGPRCPSPSSAGAGSVAGGVQSGWRVATGAWSSAMMGPATGQISAPSTSAFGASVAQSKRLAVCTCVYLFVGVYQCVCVCVYMRVCVSVCVYMRVRVCVHLCGGHHCSLSSSWW